MWTCDRCEKACNRMVYPGRGEPYTRHIRCETLLVGVHGIQFNGDGWAKDGYSAGDKGSEEK
jgi:hypothetical protein